MPAKKRARRARKNEEVEYAADYQNENYRTPRSGPSNLLIILLIVVSFFAGYLFFKLKSVEQAKTVANQQTGQAAPTVGTSQIKSLFTDDYIHFGDASRKVLFVEITDPSCPYCHAAGGHDPEVSKQLSPRFQYMSDSGTYTPPVPEMKKLVDQGNASLAIIYSPGHGSGQLAMEALYCANEKGKFWDAHDLIMSNNGYTLLNETLDRDQSTRTPLDNDNNRQQIVNFFSSVVDPNFLKDCLSSGKYNAKINRDIQVGQSLGFQGTPQFFVNTTPFMGAYDWKQIQSSVQL